MGRRRKNEKILQINYVNKKEGNEVVKDSPSSSKNDGHEKQREWM